ncbi:MAG: T9SS type A sorting domain-containing protein [Chlorobi bacterium]|nr:T9SS type A sorting domain-containing protein [Chlorobiota bacterium]
MKKKAFTYLFFFAIPFLAFAQWADNPYENTMVNDSTGLQAVPMVVTNSSGESYISWYSATEGFRFDVFLQKFDKNGLKLWDKGGLLISNHATQTWVTTYDMILDNDENVVLVTQDQRTGNSNVFAYKISPEGNFLWGDDGLQLSNTTGFDPSPKIALADNNDVVFMWDDNPADTLLNSTVIVKRVSQDGNILWETNLADTAYDFILPQILHTENDDFIVSWMTKSNLRDTIPGQINWMHVFTQKLDLDGNPVWENNIRIDSGQLMSYLSLHTTPYLNSDGEGGAYVMWQSFYSLQQEGGKPTTYVNRLYENGSLWNPNGRSVSRLLNNYHTGASMAYLSEVDKLMLAWTEYHYDAAELTDCFGIYGQLFGSDGQYLWDENGKEIIPLNCTRDTSYFNLLLRESPDNNAALVYQKDFFSINEGDTAIRDHVLSVAIDTDGNFVWYPNIVPLSLTSSYKLHAFMGNLIDNQWVIAWEDNIENPDNYFYTGIYAQNLGVDGEIGPLAIHTQPEKQLKNITAFPNPSADQIQIEYSLPADGLVEIDLFDVNGKMVKTIYSEEKRSGNHDFVLQIADLKPGVYFLRIQQNGTFGFHKIIRIK